MSSYSLGIALLAAYVVSEGSAQLCLKQSTRSESRFWIPLAIVFFILPIVVYTWALRILPVSFVFPLSSLTLVFVALLSRVFFGDRISPVRWIGIGLIFTGVILIAYPH